MKLLVQALAISMTVAAGAQAQESTATVAPANGGSVTATVQAPAAAKKSKFGATVYTYNNVGVKSLHNSNTESDQYIRLTGKYSLSDTKSLSLYGQMTHTFGTDTTAAGPGRAAKSKVGDVVLQYTDSKLAALPYDWNVSLAVRGYLPTGEDSRFKTKRAGAALGILSIEKSIGRLDLGHYTYGLFHNQTQDYYYDNAKLKANDDFEIDQYFGLEYHVTSVFSLLETIGTEHAWARGIPGDGVQRTTNFSNELGIGLKFSEKFSMQGTVLTTNAMDSQNAFNAFADEETVYRTYLTLNM